MVQDMHVNPTQLFLEHYDELEDFMTQPARPPVRVPGDILPFLWERKHNREFMFLKFVRNGTVPVLNCFVNSQDFHQPAVMVRFSDFTLWVTAKFFKGAVVIPLSHQYIYHDTAIYLKHGIVTNDYLSYIDAFEALSLCVFSRPNNYSSALMRHLVF